MAGTASTTPLPPPTSGGGTPSTQRSPLGAYHDPGQLEGWLGRRLACKSFYGAQAPGWELDNHPEYRDGRTHVFTNAPYAPDAWSGMTPTDRIRRRASGEMDAWMAGWFEALGNALGSMTAVIGEVEFQCWWNGGDGGGDINAWKAGAQRCFSIGKSILGDRLIYSLCPSHNWPANMTNGGTRSCPTAWTDWYIGDQYCDAVGMTLYSTTRPSTPGHTVYGSTVQDQLIDPRNDWGPEAMFAFAVNHGKRFVIAEYGPMYGVGQTSFTQAYDQLQAEFFQYSFDRWLNKSTTALTVYFNEMSSDGGHKLDNLPIARQKFIELWT